MDNQQETLKKYKELGWLGGIIDGEGSIDLKLAAKKWSKGKYLTVTNTSDYADVKAQDLNTSWTSQEWIIDSTSLDIVKLKNVWSGKYLTVTSQNEYADIRCQPLNPGWTSQNWALDFE